MAKKKELQIIASIVVAIVIVLSGFYTSNALVSNAPGISAITSSTDNAVVRWDGTGGNTVQDSGIIIDDSDNITGINSLTATTLTVSGYATGDLTVVGDGFFNGGDLSLGTGLATTTMTGDGTGIGISSTSPSKLLSVDGGGYISGNLFVGGAIQATSTASIEGFLTVTEIGFDADNNINFSVDNTFTFDVGATAGSIVFDADSYDFNATGIDFDFDIDSNNIASIFHVDGGDDRVGIATVTPGTLFSVQGLGLFGSFVAEGTTTASVFNATSTATSTFSGYLDVTSGLQVTDGFMVAGTNQETQAATNTIDWENGGFQEITSFTSDAVVTFEHVRPGQTLRLSFLLEGGAEPSWATTTEDASGGGFMPQLYFTKGTTSPPVLEAGYHLCSFAAGTTTNATYLGEGEPIFAACNITFLPL